MGVRISDFRAGDPVCQSRKGDGRATLREKQTCAGREGIGYLRKARKKLERL
jgi:hypothetical protein